jgi:F0F1-type ATP synthase gamma subunit
MSQSIALKSELEFINTLSLVTHAYQDIALMRLQKTRSEVLATRQFFVKLQQVYYEIKRDYHKQIEYLVESERKQKKVEKKENIEIKRAIVLMSTNDKLTGELPKRLFDSFLNALNKSPSAALFIIGHVGEEYYRETGSTRDYQYFEFTKGNIEDHDDEFHQLALILEDYEEVEVYHGHFQTLFTQIPMDVDITGEASLEQLNTLQSSTHQDKDLSFLVEPSLEKVVNHFRQQVRYILLKQTVHESELAFNASRAVAMEEANRQINGKKLALAKAIVHSESNARNKKQLGALNRILWSETR